MKSIYSRKFLKNLINSKKKIRNWWLSRRSFAVELDEDGRHVVHAVFAVVSIFGQEVGQKLFQNVS
jgi:hypothetical protein